MAGLTTFIKNEKTTQILRSRIQENGRPLGAEWGILCLGSPVARELDVGASVLRRWKREYEQYGDGGFSGHGKHNMAAEQREIAHLKKQLREAEIERDILKKAVGIFSKKNDKSSHS